MFTAGERQGDFQIFSPGSMLRLLGKACWQAAERIPSPITAKKTPPADIHQVQSGRKSERMPGCQDRKILVRREGIEPSLPGREKGFQVPLNFF
jgi:hypothetical protein